MFKSRLAIKSVSNAVRWISDSAGESFALRGSRIVLTGERGINQVTLLGRAGQDPQLRGTQEHSVTVFPLATSFTLKSPDGEYTQKTEWHRVTVFRPVLRDIVSQSIRRGDKVFVSGRISYSQYKDKNEATQRTANIIADDVILVSRSAARLAEEADSETAEEMGGNQ